MSYQREFSKRIKVGMIGIGGHGYRNILPILHYLPVELCAVVNDGVIEEGQITASEYGCRYYPSTKDMYAAEELDAVILCVSPRIHPALAIEALSHGCDVWMEKPPALSAEAIKSVLSANKTCQKVVVGFKKAFSPAAEKSVEVCNDPAYGNLKSILAVYPTYIEQRRTDKPSDWILNGVHPVSYLIRVGGQAEWVETITANRGDGLVVIGFCNGVIGNLHLARGPQPIEQFRLFGEGWHLTVDNGETISLQRDNRLAYGRATTYAPEGFDSGALVWKVQQCLATLECKSEFIQGMYQEMNYFCSCILENRQPVIGSLAFAIDVMNVIDAAQESFDCGKRVRL